MSWDWSFAHTHTPTHKLYPLSIYSPYVCPPLHTSAHIFETCRKKTFFLCSKFFFLSLSLSSTANFKFCSETCQVLRALKWLISHLRNPPPPTKEEDEFRSEDVWCSNKPTLCVCVRCKKPNQSLFAAPCAPSSVAHLSVFVLLLLLLLG